MKPYYQDDQVALYFGDMREIVPALGITADACITDPPYGETSLTWDRWPDGWPDLVAESTSSLWCFGSMRMLLERRDEFVNWRLAQDYVGEFEVDTMVWEKTQGSGPTSDRFVRVHELAVQWYRGLWRDIYHEVPRVPAPADRVNRIGSQVRPRPSNVMHRGDYRVRTNYLDDGLRLARSVVRAKNLRGIAIHPTEKPGPVLAPLIQYSVPPNGMLLDPFAGSGAMLLTARKLGRHSIGIEADEEYCERAAKRLAIPDLFWAAES